MPRGLSASWNLDNREESKPVYLTPEQRRFAFRSNRGWEIPLEQSLTGHPKGGNQKVSIFAIGGASTTGGLDGLQQAIRPHFEVVVAIPAKKSGNTLAVDGASTAGSVSQALPMVSQGAKTITGSSLTGGGFSADYVKIEDVRTQFTPIINCPFHGDSHTAGGPDGYGVSHDTGWGHRRQYGATAPPGTYMNRYGVSSLQLDMSTLTGGQTAWIKILANTPYVVQELKMGMTGSRVPGGGRGALGLGGQSEAVFGIGGISGHFGEDLLNTDLVPEEVFTHFFGPTHNGTNGCGVVTVAGPRGSAHLHNGDSAMQLSGHTGITHGNYELFITCQGIGGASADRTGKAVFGLTSGWGGFTAQHKFTLTIRDRGTHNQSL